MKIECVKEKIGNAIAKAEKVTGKNLTLPVLSCILLEVKKHTLTVRATNLDLGIEITIPVKVINEGNVAVPGTVLHNYLTNLHTSNTVTLETVEGNLKVSTKNNSTVIKSLPADDFPTIPRITDGKKMVLDPKGFVKGLKSVWYSAAISSMKPELSSIYIYTHDNFLVFVATDSFRLAEKKVSVKKASDFGNILIPFKNIPEIIRVLEDVEGECEVYINKNQISFLADTTYITSRIIDGTFPDYKQIVPKTFKTEVVVLKQDLVNTLRIANIFSDKFNKLSLVVYPSKKSFEVLTRNADVGENINRLDAALTGEDIESNFNYKYITDSFQSIDADSVTLKFNGIGRPVVIQGVNDTSFTYLVMSMNK